MGPFGKFTDVFRAHRPELGHVPESRENTTPIGKLISEWRQRPGEIISLNIPEATDFGTDLNNPTVVGHLGVDREPTARIEGLKELSILSINLNALGQQRNDEKNRNNEAQCGEETRFIQFLKTSASEADVICLQDVPLYRLRLLGPQIQALGFSWYGNVSGINGDAPGHLNGQVTLFNARKFALKGYSVGMPALSLTPHFQGTHREKVGETGVRVSYGEPDWRAAYGPKFRPNSVDHHASQTFNTTFVIRGVDGSIPLSIGNTYIAAPSFMAERSQTVRSVLANEKKLAINGIAVITGDMNTYGYDAAMRHFGTHSFPATAVAGMAVNADAKEVEHIQKVGERLGFMRANLGDKHTISAPLNLAGMQLDHIFVSGADQVTAQPIPVDFTDHKVLASTVVLHAE